MNTCSIQDSEVLYRGPSINNWVAIRHTCEGKCSKVCIYRVDSYQNMSLEFVKYIFCFIIDIVDSIMKGNHKTIVRNVLSSSDLLLINYQTN